MDGTDQKIDTPLARGRSRVVRYELIDKDGRMIKQFSNVLSLCHYVNEVLSDQEQDPDRTGKGWDIQVVGS